MRLAEKNAMTPIPRLYLTWFSSCGEKRNDTNPTSLSHLVLKLVLKQKTGGDLE